MAQDYPGKRRRLLILDDAGQITPQDGDGWSLRSTSVRMPTLVAKYVFLEAVDGGWADAFVIWDDDDIYLPWHLAAHAKMLQHAQWSHPKLVCGRFMVVVQNCSRLAAYIGLPLRCGEICTTKCKDSSPRPVLTSTKRTCPLGAGMAESRAGRSPPLTCTAGAGPSMAPWE
jgi:hypothetical protein